MPTRPTVRLSLPFALTSGVLAGTLLAFAVTRPRLRRPRWPRGRCTSLAARHGLLGLFALNEEIVWRRVLLGELLASGTVPALGLSTVAFALAHRARGLHLVTGAAFGVLYVVTGTLSASVAAHWVYNAVVATSLDRSSIRSGTAP